MYVFMGPLKTFLFVLQTQEYMFLSCGLIQWSILKAHTNCLVNSYNISVCIADSYCISLYISG